VRRGIMRSFLPLALAGLALALLSGCASQAALIDSLAKDPASNCIVVSTPYGGILVARATPGVKINLAGGTCSVDASAAPAL
jgi:hypothetical protein